MQTIAVKPAVTRRTTWLMTVVFRALTFYVGNLIMIGVHEIIGHGGAALLLGGKVLGIYLSVLLGTAFAEMPTGPGDWRYEVELAAGGAVNIIVGLLAWVLLRRVHGFAPRLFLWFVAFLNVLCAILYIGAEPLLNMVLHSNEGDFSRLYADLHISPLLPGILVLMVGLWVTTRALSQAQEIVQTHLPSARPSGPFVAFWRLALPGTVLTLVYFVAAWPWLSYWVLTTDSFFVGATLVYSILGALALSWMRRRGARDTVTPPPAMPSHPPAGLLRWIAVFAVLSVAVLVVFGPTIRLARGIALQTMVPEAFLAVDAETQLKVALQPDGTALLQVTMRPIASPESPLEQQIAKGARQTGPGPQQIARVLDVTASVLFHVPTAESDGPARRVGDAWVMEGTVQGVPEHEWTLELPPEAASDINRIEVDAPGLELIAAQPGNADVSARPGSIVWTRSADTEKGVSLHLRWKS